MQLLSSLENVVIVVLAGDQVERINRMWNTEQRSTSDYHQSNHEELLNDWQTEVEERPPKAVGGSTFSKQVSISSKDLEIFIWTLCSVESL